MYVKVLLVSVLFVVFWSTTPATSTLISNLNLIFETFNPISMVRFFEFNDKGWNITDGCIQDMFVYLDGLHKDIFWAVKCKFLFLLPIIEAKQKTIANIIKSFC